MQTQFSSQARFPFKCSAHFNRILSKPTTINAKKSVFLLTVRSPLIQIVQHKKMVEQFFSLCIKPMLKRCSIQYFEEEHNLLIAPYRVTLFLQVQKMLCISFHVASNYQITYLKFL